MIKKDLCIAVDPLIASALRDAAKEHGVTQSWIVDTLIDRYLNQLLASIKVKK